METVLSQRGQKLIVVNKFKFYRVYVTQEGVRWRCVNKACKAKIYVDESETILLREEEFHNHEAEKEDIQLRKAVSNKVKRKAVEDIYERPSKLIHSELKTNSQAISHIKTSDIYRIRKCIYNARRKQYPALPKTNKEVHDILETICVVTAKNEQFLLENNREHNIIIFSCPTNLKALCSSTSIYVDGTFNYCPKYFLQMFTIHILKNGHYIPLVFCLLPNKNKNTYLLALQIIARKCVDIIQQNFYPKQVVADFEQGIHGAVYSMWKNVTIIGCKFHLGQAWWRKIQSLGLSTEYKDTTSEIGKWLTYIFGLPLLDPEEVSDCFVFDLCSIQPNTSLKLNEFTDFLIENYISEEARFPPHIWAANIASAERTTNACESFHAHFNSQFYSSHPNIYVFLDVLKNIQTDVYIKLNSLDLPVSVNNKRYRMRLQYLNSLVNKYQSKEINRFDFVKCASFYFRKK